ncbi:LOW QUALITY PROTEIN: hypothetical protein CVT25_013226 [Psilocybe cyanescens]|uniref:Endonuclease/exonuclease/phosphatase domain-containing protein n=1 Tax=Psilocybe cyanescens TaxID=93625 RepID=A0A409X0H9_PSICY|nr:LOW QUALITY PROTEIN: hypothetical protein CVT25_013226 [Psilocybe cyanescens]
MVEHQEGQPDSKQLRFLQINLNKSEVAHKELLNSGLSSKYDIILIQEPHITFYDHIITNNHFRQVYPPGRHTLNTTVRNMGQQETGYGQLARATYTGHQRYHCHSAERPLRPTLAI